MTREETVRMAKEAGFETDPHDVWITDGYWANELERFAKLAVAEEREACAKICDELVLEHPGRADLTANQCAAAIRARGNK